MQLQFPLKPRPPGARRKSLIERRKGASPAPVRHGYVKSFDGTKLFYSVEGSGKPLVFCYGLVCSSLHWTYQIEHFKNHYQAIWLDYRGHNNSEFPQDPKTLTLENIAKDVAAVLDELKVKEAVFLGHSMGVNVVLELLRQQPERVLAMVLANGTPKRPLETLFGQNYLQSVFGLLNKTFKKRPELVKFFWKLQKGNPLARSIISIGGFNPHLTPQADIELYIDTVAAMNPEVLIQLAENYDRADATPWLHTVDVPTLLLAGAQDKITPLELSELMHQLIPNSRLEVIPHGSHCPQMDLPDLFNVRVEKFLMDISYGSRPNRTKETASQSTGKRPSPDRATRA